MMGPTHSMSGAAAGAGIAVLAGSQGVDLSPATVLVLTGMTAGAALLPDLDHPSATLARTWGPLSKGLSRLTNSASAGIVNVTGTHKDKKISNGHRTFTHTFFFALLAGIATFVTVSAWGTTAAAIMFFILGSLAMQGLMRDKVRSMGPIAATLIAAAGAWFVSAYLPETISPFMLGLAVTLGCVAHMAGDAVTVSGIPAFAPFISINGERWADVHLLPNGLRVRAAGTANTVAFWACTFATVVLLAMALNHV